MHGVPNGTNPPKTEQFHLSSLSSSESHHDEAFLSSANPRKKGGEIPVIITRPKFKFPLHFPLSVSSPWTQGLKIPFQKETQYPESQRVSPKGDGKGLNILTLNLALDLLGAEWWDWSLLTPTTSQKSSWIPYKFSIPAVLGATRMCLDSWYRRILSLTWLSHFKTKPSLIEPTKKMEFLIQFSQLEIQPLEKDGTRGDEVILQPWNKSWRRGSAFPQALCGAEIPSVTTSSCSWGVSSPAKL